MPDQLDPIAARRLAEQPRHFTSELSVAEFALLQQMGCQPADPTMAVPAPVTTM